MKKLVIIATLLCGTWMHAQTGGYQLEATGSVSPIILDHVQKINDDAATKDTVLPAPKFTYPVQSKKYMTTVQLDTIKAAKLGSEPLNKLYRTYARFGIGNYSTMLGEFSVSSLRSKTSAWGIYGSHLSAGQGPKDVAGEFSGYSKQNIDLWGKYFFKKHSIGGGFDYARNAVSLYGTAADTGFFKKDVTRQRYNTFLANMEVRSHYTDSTQINHTVGLRYYHFNDLYKVTEDNVLLDIDAGRYIRTEYLDVKAGVDFNHNGGTDTLNNAIVRLSPTFSTKGNKFNAGIGFDLFINSGETSLTYFLPHAFLSYDFVNHIIVPYVQLANDMRRNSFRSLTGENPFISSSQVFTSLNTLDKFQIRAGLRGSLSEEINYDLYAMRYNAVNAPFFVNTLESQDIYRNKFTVVYDNAEVSNIHGQIGWRNRDKLQITATGDWFHYAMSNEKHPWYTPTLRLSLTGDYNLGDKIVTRLNVYYLNGQYARFGSGNTVSAVQMKGLVDVNLAVEYRYSKFLSAFIDLNNIANQRYYRWYGYPTQKFNFIAGLTYTF
jgi:hypothetical protein